MKEVPKVTGRGASVSRKSAADVGQAWWMHHRVSSMGSLGRLFASPMQTLMTSLVVAIALALPATLFAVLDNIYALGDRWDSKPKISVYLDVRAQNTAVNALQGRIEGFPGVASIDVVSSDQALKQFQQHSGFGEALNLLDDNPLPITLVITPTEDALEPLSLQKLMSNIKKEPLVDEVQMDMAWVKRLKAIMALGQQIVMGLGCLLGLGVLLAIGNTIRLEIENRRDEIIIIKLVGGTNGFVRRPLLYTGLWYGLLGGVLAALLVFAAFASLDGAVLQVASSYQAEFALRGLGVDGVFGLMLAGAALGLLGAWFAIGRHLSAIEPK